MNGGHACCALELCCRKRSDRVRALAELIEHHEAILASAEERPLYRIAEVIIDSFDLVPKGVGTAIINGYEPYFAEKAKQDKGE